MKRYIKTNTEYIDYSGKPLLDFISTEWEELEDESGIKFTVYDIEDNKLFEEVFDYSDVDSDAIYDSAIEMARVALQQKYDLIADAAEVLGIEQ